MKTILKTLFALLIVWGNSTFLSASHLVGGEITYKCLGNNEYEITLIVYRDSVNGNPGAFFDDPLALGIFDATTGALIQTPMIALNNYSTIQIPSYLGNIGLTSNLGFQRGEYKTVLTLPYRATGYQLTYQRCCRNNIITNIINPSSTGFTMTTIITTEAMLSCNNSPIPQQDVPLFLCVADSFFVDMSAIDMEGDSLSYGFYTPFNGASTANPMPSPPSAPPYTPFIWQTPFSQNTPFNDVYIDPVTGLMVGIRGSIGYFAMGIYINEYRNGQLLSTTYRDFSITIVPCIYYSQVGVNSIETPLEALITPNPTTSILSISLKSDAKANVRVLSSLGQELSSTTFLKNTDLDLSPLPSGVYFVDITADKQRLVQKIVKE